jgi:hypothetical protein
MRNLFRFASRWKSSPFEDLIYEPGGEERLEGYQVDHPMFDNTNAIILQPGCLPELAGIKEIFHSRHCSAVSCKQ